MEITYIEIRNVRNLDNEKLAPSPQLNIFFGNNASGKTSVLESIYLLSVARSFRTTHVKEVIQYNKESLQVFAKISNSLGDRTVPVGIERTSSKYKIKINNQNISNLADLSSLLPVQIINPDVHKLLEQGPKIRRQFLDWGVFHVEHVFLNTWKQYYRVLKQRNAALRAKQIKDSVILWDNQLISLAKTITLSREKYLQGILPFLKEYIFELLDLEVVFSYSRGWKKDSNLTDVLSEGFIIDSQRGYTRNGPHRADLLITYNNVPVEHCFSRGQQKLLVCAMRLAQISYLKQHSNIVSIVLIDDLAAELDIEHRNKLLNLLFLTDAQLFITATEKNAFQLPQDKDIKMFHVEHGNVKEVV